ncbi:MAG: ComEC/Rec2 family competence protein [Cytophagaceae bacterium]|jgi:ComEC/Rec2-related protein|nr:ComEC/Rec2 family competence protein [Cytophagaceae bacterium]
MVSFWKGTPFFRIFLFFVLGICFTSFVELELQWLLIGSVALTLGLGWNLTLRSYLPWVWLFIAGMVVNRNIETPVVSEHSGHVRLVCQERFASGRSLARMEHLPGKPLVFVGDTLPWGPGMQMLAVATVKKNPSSASNSFYVFLQSRKVYYKVTSIQANSISISENWVDRYRWVCFVLKNKLHTFLIESLGDGPEADLTLSLLMGGTAHLNKELKEQFKGAGVMHIIAVSGMHLALIFTLLAQVLFFIKQNKRIDLPTLVLCLVVIWLYAGLTGFSASVLRAALMFSTFVLSHYVRRGYHPWNALFSSAFLLLLWKPSYLFDLGFQLSYLAVAGIFLANPILQKLERIPSKVLRYSASALVLNLAAQAMVSPLLIYTFSTFPAWFLLSNFIMVPLSTLAIYGGVLHVSLGWMVSLRSITAWGCLWPASALIYLSEVFNYSLYFRMDVFECLGIYAWMLCLMLFALRKRLGYLVLAFGLSTFLMAYHSWPFAEQALK